MEEGHPDLKVVLVGPPDSGKSSMILSFFVTMYFILLVMGGPRLLVNNNKPIRINELDSCYYSCWPSACHWVLTKHNLASIVVQQMVQCLLNWIFPHLYPPQLLCSSVPRISVWGLRERWWWLPSVVGVGDGRSLSPRPSWCHRCPVALSGRFHFFLLLDFWGWISAGGIAATFRASILVIIILRFLRFCLWLSWVWWGRIQVQWAVFVHCLVLLLGRLPGRGKSRFSIVSIQCLKCHNSQVENKLGKVEKKLRNSWEKFEKKLRKSWEKVEEKLRTSL